MINLEGIANKITISLFRDSGLDEVEKAKIEFGLSLVLGIGFTMAISMVLAMLLGTVFETLMLTVSALGLRLFSGGAHCSSYGRCLVISLMIFVTAAALVRHMTGNLSQSQIVAISLVLFTLIMLYLLTKKARLAGLVILYLASAATLSLVFKRFELPEVMFAVIAGFFIQTAMITKAGQRLIGKADQLLKFVETGR